MNAWLFDVDGVITSPTDKKITQPQILDQLIKRLKKGEPIGLNTGRSRDFVVEKVLIPLEEKIEERNLLNLVVAVAEKGGVFITYENEERVEKINQDLKVPEELINRVRKLTESEFSDTMFFDETKRTMISVEMLDSSNLDTFHEKQNYLVERLNELLEELSLSQNLEIDPTNIAIDVENKHVGKDLGTKIFLNILEKKGITPSNFICFGDSKSDFEMLDELNAADKKVEFVFVGKDTDRTDIIRTEKNYDKGTLEYLINH